MLKEFSQFERALFSDARVSLTLLAPERLRDTVAKAGVRTRRARHFRREGEGHGPAEIEIWRAGGQGDELLEGHDILPVLGAALSMKTGRDARFFPQLTRKVE